MRKERDKEWADYYDQVNILDELLEEPAEFRLGERLRREILSKKRKRKLQNGPIKIDLPLCEALGFPRASLYRRARKASSGLPSSRSV